VGLISVPTERFAADASLSCRSNICCWRFAFAQIKHCCCRLGHKDVGHEGLITGHDAFCLQGLIWVVRSSFQSTYTHGIRFTNVIPNFWRWAFYITFVI